MEKKHSGSLLAAVAAMAFVLTGADAVAAQQAARTEHSHRSPAAPVGRRSLDAASLRRDMRKLWSDHVIWTREYIVAAVAGTPDAGAAATRLMKNQEDIGRAIAVFYGNAAGDKLTGLLKQHILIAVDVVAAAKEGDQAGYAAAANKWKQNAEEIADFLSAANPNWPKAALADMMNMHLQTTTDEVVARLNKRWDEDVAAFDHVYAHILKMADALAEGIVKQFAAAS